MAPTIARVTDADAPDSDLPAGPPGDVTHPRAIRTFVRRAGRTTTGQARAYEQLGPTFLLQYTGEPLDFAAAFGRDAPVVLKRLPPVADDQRGRVEATLRSLDPGAIK